MITARSLLVALLASAPVTAAAEPPAYPGKESPFENRFPMFVDDGNRIVVPRKEAEGRPWVWRARFWGHEPQFDLAMLEKGYHVVYCDVAGLLGNPTAVQRWNEHHAYLTGELGFSPKPVLEGMSRGGMIIYNWAIANPDKVAAIYGDAPVMDLRSWPGAGHQMTLRAYGFKDAAEATAYSGYPIDNLEPLAKAGVPIIHVVGDLDKTVPVAANTALAEKRYKAMGGTMKVIHKPETGHHPHSLKDPAPIVAFIEEQVEHRKPAAPATNTFTGTLQGGIFAIGGETTGWQLKVRADGKATTIDVDLSAIKEPGQFDGKEVTITGDVITKNYVERGPTKILLARKINDK